MKDFKPLTKADFPRLVTLDGKVLAEEPRNQPDLETMGGQKVYEVPTLGKQYRVLVVDDMLYLFREQANGLYVATYRREGN